jgi:hypothetical protein
MVETETNVYRTCLALFYSLFSLCFFLCVLGASVVRLEF